MTAADIATFVGALFTAYGSGWMVGYLIYVFKRSSDFI